jgi:hypothetical protein
MDEVRAEFEQVAHFVGLEMSDEMPVDVVGQERDLLFEFLDSALAEMSLSGVVRFAYRLYGVELTHAHERDVRG